MFSRRAIIGALFSSLVFRETTSLSHLAAAPYRASVKVDHHVHLHAPEMIAFLPTYCAGVARFGTCDPAITKANTPADLLRQMDEAGVARALVLSTAYLAESPMFATAVPEADQLVRAANDFTVNLARHRPARFGAFISIHPFSDHALPEIARWRGNRFVAGLKLHLTSSMADLRDHNQLRQLAAVFGAAADNGFATIVHLRTADPRYGAEDVRNFLGVVVPAAKGAPIQIAHGGG